MRDGTGHPPWTAPMDTAPVRAWRSTGCRSAPARDRSRNCRPETGRGWIKSSPRGIRAAVAHPGMLELGFDDVDPVSLGLLRGREHAGIGFEMRVVRAERRIFILSLSTKGTRRLSSVTTFDVSSGCCWAKNIAMSPPVGMSDQRQVMVVGVRLQFFQLAEHERILASPR